MTSLEVVDLKEYLKSLSHKKLEALILIAAEQNFALEQYLVDLVRVRNRIRELVGEVR